MAKKLLAAALLVVIFVLSTACTVSEEPEAIVSFTFDDGTIDHYENAFPILSKYGVVGTEHVIVGLVGGEFENETLMGWEEITQLYDAGWDIHSHTMTHPFLTQMSEEDLVWELTESKRILEEKGFVVSGFAPPYGDVNDEVKSIALEYYDTVRPSTYGTNNISATDFDDIKSIWIVNTTTLEEMKDFVDKAYEKKAWLVFMIHLVRDDLSREYTMTPEDLDALLAYVIEKGINVKTISQVYEEKYGKEE